MDFHPGDPGKKVLFPFALKFPSSESDNISMEEGDRRSLDRR